MYDSFTAQLAGIDLTGFSVQPAPFNETDFPADEALIPCAPLWPVSRRKAPLETPEAAAR